MNLRVFLVTGGAVLCTGCAGPTSPFGAVNEWFVRGQVSDESEAPPAEKNSSVVGIEPARQILHKAAPFAITITDPDGVPPNHRIQVTHNGVDVTETFLKKARFTASRDWTQIRYALPAIRIPARRGHEIEVTYRRETGAPAEIATLVPPTCVPFESRRELASIPDYAIDPSWIDAIAEQSRASGFNPHFVAGLIAQESSFNPAAISRSRALGLTQVTPLGEAEIFKAGRDWPRYPGLSSMPLLALKYTVASGKAHADNEWRLNPRLSIRGGLEYLTYLHEYWRKSEKRSIVAGLVEKRGPMAWTELLLASYNSGAARVSGAIERHGSHWLEDAELNQARYYVRRISSFCDYFARGGSR